MHQCSCEHMTKHLLCTGWIPGKTDAKALWGLLTSSWLNLLLLVVPIGWAVHFAHLNSILVFCLVSTQLCLASVCLISLCFLSRSSTLWCDVCACGSIVCFQLDSLRDTQTLPSELSCPS